MSETKVTNDQKREIKEYIDNFTTTWTDFMSKLYDELQLVQPSEEDKDVEQA